MLVGPGPLFSHPVSICVSSQAHIEKPCYTRRLVLGLGFRFGTQLLCVFSFKVEIPWESDLCGLQSYNSWSAELFVAVEAQTR